MLSMQPVYGTDRTIDWRTPQAERKALLRAEAKAIRREVWLKPGAGARQALPARGAALIGAMRAFSVAGYVPVHDELDPLPLLHALHEQGMQTALPAIRPGPDLAFRSWEPGAPLVPGKYGLQEPGGECAEITPDIVLVPLLAFDRKGGRLGYGGGYYDAALRRMRAAAPVTAIGIAFDEQEFPEVPQEPQDERLELILTPTRVIACGE
jgi:5-formyltetrahydrofolate cyclo-ligase